MSFLDALVAITSRRRLVITFPLIVALLTLAIVFILPKQYTAESVVLPPAQNSSLSSMLLSQIGGGGALASMAGAGLGIKSPGDMYVALFRSRTVEDAIIQKFGLASRYKSMNMVDARHAFEANSTVVLGVKDGLIRITITDKDPRLAAEIANGYVHEFQLLTNHLAITEAAQRRMFFDQQMIQAKDNLADAEDALKHTEQTSGVLQIDSQARSLIEAAAQIRAQIVAKDVQIQAMQTYATSENPALTTLVQEKSALEAQLAKLGGTSTDASSELIMPKGNIPQAGIEYYRRIRDVKYYETIFELIAKQYELAKLDEAREGAVVQVADTAVIPDKKSSPHRGLIVIFMTMLAFAVAVLWVLTSAGLAQMRQDPVDGAKLQLIRMNMALRRK